MAEGTINVSFQQSTKYRFILNLTGPDLDSKVVGKMRQDRHGFVFCLVLLLLLLWYAVKILSKKYGLWLNKRLGNIVGIVLHF